MRAERWKEACGVKEEEEEGGFEQIFQDLDLHDRRVTHTTRLSGFSLTHTTMARGGRLNKYVKNYSSSVPLIRFVGVTFSFDLVNTLASS